MRHPEQRLFQLPGDRCRSVCGGCMRFDGLGVWFGLWLLRSLDPLLRRGG